MAYRRKRTYRKTYKKRTFRKRRTIRRKGTQKIYQYKRLSGAFSTFVLSNVANAYTAYNFSLGDVPNYTEFTALYDYYKINAVKVTLLPQMTQNVSLGDVNNAWASKRLFSAIDYNDSSAVTTIDEIRQYQTCKFTPILKRHTRYFKPRINDSGSVFTPGRPWLLCSSPNTNYFGIKLAGETMNSSGVANMEYTVEVMFYLSFKNVK